MLPERSAESMKGFFQKQEKTQLETFLVQCLHDKVEWCFSIRKIPSKDFEERFRDQFTVEFQHLESQAEVAGDDSDDFNSGYFASASIQHSNNSHKSSSSFSNGSLVSDKENVAEKKENEAPVAVA